jgi:hypothetical protein
MAMPGIDDLLVMSMNQSQRLIDLLMRKPLIQRQFDIRL